LESTNDADDQSIKRPRYLKLTTDQLTQLLMACSTPAAPVTTPDNSPTSVVLVSSKLPAYINNAKYEAICCRPIVPLYDGTEADLMPFLLCLDIRRQDEGWASAMSLVTTPATLVYSTKLNKLDQSGKTPGKDGNQGKDGKTSHRFQHQEWMFVPPANHSEALAINFIRHQPAHVIPRERSHALPPLPVQEYEPSTTLLPLQAKEKMLQLATFQSTYHGSVAPITPDMTPLIFDAGASVSISPCRSDFVTPHSSS
jgi:hypothetical protein